MCCGKRQDGGRESGEGQDDLGSLFSPPNPMVMLGPRLLSRAMSRSMTLLHLGIVLGSVLTSAAHVATKGCKDAQGPGCICDHVIV